MEDNNWQDNQGEAETTGGSADSGGGQNYSPVRDDGTYSTGPQEPEPIYPRPGSPAPGWQTKQNEAGPSYYSNQPGQGSGDYTGQPVHRPQPSPREQRKADKEQRRQERSSGRRGPSWAAVIAIALAACLLGGAAGGFLSYWAASADLTSLQSTVSEQEIRIAELEARPTAVPAAGDSGMALPEGTLTVTQVAEMASPAVVAIGSKVPRQTYFGVFEQVGAGSGVLISSDGFIVTNNHVVEGSIETIVTLASGEEYPAEIVGTDSTTDLAVVKIEVDEDLPYLTWGDSTELRVGDPVVAIGNPTGVLQGTVTEGVVSALNRTITVGDGSGGESTTMYNVIQTSAAINAGNSGGALLDGRGNLIGINSAKPIEVGVEGIAFAIPAETAKPVVEQLKTGSVDRPFVGISGQTVPADNSWNLPTGAMITEVLEGSPADDAGLKVTDIITEMDGNPVTSIADISGYIAAMKPGDTISLTIVRSGEELEVEVTLGETPTNMQAG